MGNVTIKDIAKETGVSIATVSRVLSNSGYASQEIKEKVQAAAKKMNYQPNAVARSLKIHKTNTIGVVIPDISNSYFMKISKGIEDTIQESGYNLIFVSGDEKGNKEQKVLQVLLEKRVDAIVLATSGGNEEMINKVKQSGVPIILLDRKLKDESIELDLVEEDNVEAAFQLTSRFIEKGHKRIGIVNGPLKVSTGYERFLGYQKAMKEYGIEENEDLIYNGNFSEDDGVKAVDHFLSLAEKPSAIISFNNTMTFGVILQLKRRGYKIPEDFVIGSYGEVEAAQLLTAPGIVSINQLPYEMGVKTGQIILDRLENNVTGPIHAKFLPKLYVNR